MSHHRPALMANPDLALTINNIVTNVIWGFAELSNIDVLVWQQGLLFCYQLNIKNSQALVYYTSYVKYVHTPKLRYFIDTSTFIFIFIAVL